MTPLVGYWRIIVFVPHVYGIRKHKLNKIMETLPLFMLFLDNKRKLMQHLFAGASQHVAEEVCEVGMDVGTF
jgi:hypothetical protein